MRLDVECQSILKPELEAPQHRKEFGRENQTAKEGKSNRKPDEVLETRSFLQA